MAASCISLLAWSPWDRTGPWDSAWPLLLSQSCPCAQSRTPLTPFSPRHPSVPDPREPPSALSVRSAAVLSNSPSAGAPSQTCWSGVPAGSVPSCRGSGRGQEGLPLQPFTQDKRFEGLTPKQDQAPRPAPGLSVSTHTQVPAYLCVCMGRNDFAGASFAV